MSTHNVGFDMQLRISFMLKLCYSLLLECNALFIKPLRYVDPEDRIFNGVISDVSIELRGTTLTTSDSIERGSPVDTEIVSDFSYYKGNN